MFEAAMCCRMRAGGGLCQARAAQGTGARLGGLCAGPGGGNAIAH